MNESDWSLTQKSITNFWWSANLWSRHIPASIFQSHAISWICTFLKFPWTVLSLAKINRVNGGKLLMISPLPFLWCLTAKVKPFPISWACELWPNEQSLVCNIYRPAAGIREPVTKGGGWRGNCLVSFTFARKERGLKWGSGPALCFPPPLPSCAVKHLSKETFSHS